MSDNSHFSAEALLLAALHPDALETRAAEAHARTCVPCARELRRASAALDLIDAELRTDDSPADELRRVFQAVRRRIALAVAIPHVAVAVGCTVVLTALGSMSPTPARLLGAAALAAAGVALVWSATQGRALWALGGTFALSLLVALLSGRLGPVAADVGVTCMLAELIPAAFALGAVAVVGWRSHPLRSDPWRTVTLLATGMLIAQSGQIISCEMRDSIAHGVVFHMGAIVALTALLALALRPWRRTILTPEI
jgi:hypothetical protein